MALMRHDLCILVHPGSPSERSRGIFFAPARGIAPGTVNEMARSGRGLIACGVDPERAFHLGLQRMPGRIRRPGMPKYLASVEAASCFDTGISAADRAETLRVLGNPAARAADLCSPGHVMPCLVSDDPGSESLLALALELASLLTSVAAVAWCDILDVAGEVASAERCAELGALLGCPVIDASSIARRTPEPARPFQEVLRSAPPGSLPGDLFGRSLAAGVPAMRACAAA